MPRTTTEGVIFGGVGVSAGGHRTRPYDYGQVQFRLILSALKMVDGRQGDEEDDNNG